MRFTVAALAVLLALALLWLPDAVRAESWEGALDALLAAEDSGERQTLVDEITAAGPAWEEVAARIEGLEFPRPGKRGVQVRSIACLDGVERPWVLFVPSGYDPAEPCPLLVRLHGGVSRPEITEDLETYAEESEWTAFAEEHRMLAVYPQGQVDATWWDEVGMALINDLVRTLKREFNVDDDRVYMGGYSDGASGSFTFAMVDPSDYAAFFPLSGHMGVGSLDGDLALYAPNMYNTPVYAVTSFDDRLYPSSKMRKTIEMAQLAGGDIYYREQEGEHDFSYAPDELPRLARFLKRHPRDPFPSRVVWETSSPRFGRCRWLAIDEVTLTPTAAWHTDHNVALTDDWVIIGFTPDYTFEGEGMRVGTVHEETFAAEVGLLEGDVIVGADGVRITSEDDLDAWKTTVERGDAVEIEVLRDGQPLVFAGELPEVQHYFVFKREVPSGMARASFAGNRVKIQTSRVGALRIFVHPDMFHLERPIVVVVNGEVVFDGLVEPDLAFMLANFLEHRDRKLLYVAQIAIELKS